MSFHFHKWTKWVDGGFHFTNNADVEMVQTRCCEVCGLRQLRHTNRISGVYPEGTAKACATAVVKEGEKK
jgi:hypothetical protein